MSTSQMVLNFVCPKYRSHKNEALRGYVSPRVGPRELYRLEIALKIIIPVPSTRKNHSFKYLQANCDS